MTSSTVVGSSAVGFSAGRLSRIKGMPARGLIFVIDLYRNMVSPLRLPTCRFTPTCSQYAVDALSEYGLLRGSGLTLVRLAKCGPWHRGGWDPIPERDPQSLKRRMGAEGSGGEEVRSTCV